MSLSFDEKRRDSRHRKSDVVLWRRGANEDYRLGWALEGSASGLALAWRGHDVPSVGSIVELSLDGTRDDRTRAVVRRADNVHDDLTIIGAEYLTMRPFPPAAMARAESFIEPVDRVGFALATG